MSITTEHAQGKEAGEVMSPAEVARFFGVDPKTVTRWANAGKIRSFRTLGGHRRFYTSDVVALAKVENKN